MANESDENDKEEPKLQLLENFAVLRIDSAQIRHSGRWCVTATNPIGSDIAVLDFSIKSRPNPPSQSSVTPPFLTLLGRPCKRLQ